jgi:hypothetical protein
MLCLLLLVDYEYFTRKVVSFCVSLFIVCFSLYAPERKHDVIVKEDDGDDDE